MKSEKCPECQKKSIIVENPSEQSPFSCPLWYFKCVNPKCIVKEYAIGRFGFAREISRKDNTEPRGMIKENCCPPFCGNAELLPESAPKRLKCNHQTIKRHPTLKMSVKDLKDLYEK